MTGKELADEFYEGIRLSLTCPDVSVLEYKTVIAYKIDLAIKDAMNSERRQTLSKLRGIISRIGPATTIDFCRAAMERIANELEYWSKV